MRPGAFAPSPHVPDLSKREGLELHPFTGLFLIIFSAILFAASFPNPLFLWGLWPLAFVCLAPLFVIVRRTRLLFLFPYGFVWGALSCGLTNGWLIAYHPLAIFIGPFVIGVQMMLLLPLLGVVAKALPSLGWLLLPIAWVAYEYVKTLGFLGYPYGILGYTQFYVGPLVQAASVTGVWGPSFLTALSGAILGWFLDWHKPLAPRLPADVRQRFIVAFGLWGLLLVFCCAIGLVTRADSKSWQTARISLIQHNMDPWLGGTPTYRKSLSALKRLSVEAIKDKPQLVVWSETAFIPAIAWHLRFREDPERLELVEDLLAFLKAQPVPYVFGTDDGEPEPGGTKRMDYNAVALWDKAHLVGTYRKVHLVPFSEYFPFKEQLPAIYQWLEDNRTTFWEPGKDFSVFDAAGFRFGTPVCFEDSFGYISREFVRKGAQIIVNVTNDTWSASETAAMQHLAMATFRTTETGRTMVRATNGGMTALILPDGSISKMIPAFSEGVLTVDAPIYKGTSETLYVRWGDWLAYVFCLLAVLGLVTGFIRYTLSWLTARAQTHNIRNED